MVAVGGFQTRLRPMGAWRTDFFLDEEDDGNDDDGRGTILGAVCVFVGLM